MRLAYLVCITTKIAKKCDKYYSRDLSVLIGLTRLISTQKVLKTCNIQSSK